MDVSTQTAPTATAEAAPAPTHAPTPAAPKPDEFIDSEVPPEYLDEDLSGDELNPGLSEPGADDDGDEAPVVDPKGVTKQPDNKQPAVTAPQTATKPDEVNATAKAVFELMIQNGIVKLPEQPKAEQAVEGQPAEEDFKLEGLDDFEEPVRKTFEGLHKYHTGRYQKLETQLKSVVEYVNTQRQTAILDEMETVFGDLTTEFGEDLIGKGRYDELADGTPARANRDAILSKASILAQAYRSAGEKIPRQKQLLNEAAKLVLSEHSKTLAINEVNTAVRNRREQFTARPQSTQQPALSRRDVAIRNASAKLRELESNEEENEL